MICAHCRQRRAAGTFPVMGRFVALCVRCVASSDEPARMAYADPAEVDRHIAAEMEAERRDRRTR